MKQMYGEENPILHFLRSSALTLLLFFALFFGFIHPLYKDSFTLIPVIILIGFWGVTMCGAFTFLSKKYIVWIIMGAISVFLMVIFRKFFAYSFMSVCNHIPFAISDFYQADISCFGIRSAMKEYIHEDLLLVFLICWLESIYAYCVCEHKAVLVPFVVNLAALIFPIVLNMYQPVWVLTLEFAAVVSLVVLCVSTIKRFDSRQRSLVQRVAAMFAAFIITFGMVLGAVRPMNSFVPSPVWQDVKNYSIETAQKIVDEVQKGGTIFDVFRNLNIRLFQNGNVNITNSIGAGKLGQTDEIRFSGNEVLQVQVPVGVGKLYLLGYVGKEYTGVNSSVSYAHWDEMDSTLYNAAKEPWSKAYLYPQGLVSRIAAYADLEFTSWGGGCSIGNRYGARIRFTGLRKDRQFMPYYINYNDNGTTDASFELKDEQSILYALQLNDDNIKTLAISLDSLKNSDYALYTNFYEAEKSYRDFVYQEYLNVNTGCDDFIYELVRQMDPSHMRDGLEEENSGSCALYAYAMAEQIHDYLEKNCKYTLSPGALPDGKDFVSYFLTESKEGYCTYFASSAVMMLRAAGIPARYVEGYVVDTQTAKHTTATDASASMGGGFIGNSPVYVDGEGFVASSSIYNFSVTDDRAHAWVEFYVNGIGWVKYEMTPGIGNVVEEQPSETETQTESEPESEPETETTQKETETTVDATTSPEETISKDENPVSSEATTTQESTEPTLPVFSSRFLKFVIICLSPILIAQIVVMIVAHARRKERRFREQMEDRNRDQNELIRLNYERCERILKYVGWKQKPDETLAQFAARLGETCAYISKEDAEKLMQSYERIVFSSKNCTRADVDEIYVISQHLSRRVYRTVNILKRLVFRYILNLYI